MLLDDIQNVLKTALPAAAAAWSAKKNQLGTFGTQYLNQQTEAEKLRLEQQKLQQEKDYQTGEIGARDRAFTAQEAHYNAETARANASEHHQEAARIDKLITDALSNAAEDPAFMDTVNKAGPENFTMTVPGVGPMNLRDAFQRAPVIKRPDGTYAFGKPAPDPKVPYETVNPDGSKSTEIVPQSEAVRRGAHVTAPAPRAPEPNYTPVSEPGKPSYLIDSHTGKTAPLVPPGGGDAPILKLAPDAAALAKEQAQYDKVTRVGNNLDKVIDLVDQRGYLGPAGGRLGDILGGKVGSTGNASDDALLARLRTGFTDIVPLIDSVLTGTTRGAASPQLAAKWNAVFSGKQTKASLKAALQQIRDDLGPSPTAAKAGAAGTTPAVPATKPKQIGGFSVEVQ